VIRGVALVVDVDAEDVEHRAQPHPLVGWHAGEADAEDQVVGIVAADGGGDDFEVALAAFVDEIALDGRGVGGGRRPDGAELALVAESSGSSNSISAQGFSEPNSRASGVRCEEPADQVGVVLSAATCERAASSALR